jgi:hypothetical protein
MCKSATFHSEPNTPSCDAINVARIYKWKPYIVHGYVDCFRCIPSLLLCCGPFAIIRLIVTIIVNALNGVLWTWAKTHVGYEILERFPSVTYCNSPIEIAMRMAGRLRASLEHCLPNVILLRSLSFLRATMRRQSGLAGVNFQTSAARRVAGFYKLPDHRYGVAAVAETFPSTTESALIELRPRKSYNGKPPEFLAYNINDILCHAWRSSQLRHA